MTLTAADIAAKIGGTVEGDSSVQISHLASLADAQEGDLSFLSNKKYADQMAATKASAVIVQDDWAGACGAAALIRVKNSDRAFAVAAPLIAPPPPERWPGIHYSAVVSPEALIGKNVHIGPLCVIEDGAKIGDDCIIESQCYVGQNAEIGPGSHLYQHVTIREGVRVGARFIAHCGAVLGSDGFGYSIDMLPGGIPRIEKIPQVGTVVVGDDVEVGANTTIDRARFGETRIGNCVKIDNLVQIGHNVKIGDFSGVIAQAGIAGSAEIGSGVRIWAQAGISGHLKVEDGAQVGPQCGVSRTVPAGSYVIGTPATSLRELASQALMPGQVSKLRKRIFELEAEVKKLKEGKEK
ncbi:MAG: UDP-3-O-(3-hydroxymyristoyl)glucosamine N-acyltransferase [Kiritimatiellae bacterium]|nr:UDP-3-O-(3-hydroxymyristoyl)glucosamine N-acyltransferase [Kiritimatiellia bacterium]